VAVLLGHDLSTSIMRFLKDTFDKLSQSGFIQYLCTQNKPNLLDTVPKVVLNLWSLPVGPNLCFPILVLQPVPEVECFYLYFKSGTADEVQMTDCSKCEVPSSEFHSTLNPMQYFRKETEPLSSRHDALSWRRRKRRPLCWERSCKHE
jgi:hypothetical protein